jgi:hypothetical protein
MDSEDLSASFFCLPMALVRTHHRLHDDAVIGPGYQSGNPANLPEPNGLGVPVGSCCHRSFMDDVGSSLVKRISAAWPTHPAELTDRENVNVRSTIQEVWTGPDDKGWLGTAKPELGAEALRTGSAIITTWI